MRFVSALLAVAVLLPFPAAAEDGAQGTIATTGTGTALVAPDLAVIGLGVETLGATASQAMEGNAAPVEALIETLGEAGIEAEDISTQRLDLNPRYTRPQNQDEAPRIAGYQVSHLLEIRVRDLEALGPVLDRAIRAGANRVNQIRFASSEESAALDDARASAVADATRKARVMAEAAGVTLGPILSIRESGAGGPVPLQMAEMARTTAIPVAPGADSLSVSVSITWEID
ncbi:MAG: SIMPL domain-containing protein [Pseudomonadota bacterium]